MDVALTDMSTAICKGHLKQCNEGKTLQPKQLLGS